MRPMLTAKRISHRPILFLQVCHSFCSNNNNFIWIWIGKLFTAHFNFNVLFQPVENLTMSQAQSQLQADLQRKHAELQAIIGQQQQELRRVSEQLLMARLGLLPGAQPQPVVSNVSYSTYDKMVRKTILQGYIRKLWLW